MLAGCVAPLAGLPPWQTACADCRPAGTGLGGSSGSSQAVTDLVVEVDPGDGSRAGDARR